MLAHPPVAVFSRSSGELWERTRGGDSGNNRSDPAFPVWSAAQKSSVVISRGGSRAAGVQHSWTLTFLQLSLIDIRFRKSYTVF